MKNILTASSVLVLSTVLAASHAYAVEPASVPMGAADITPTIGVKHGYNDNLIKQNANGDIIGTQYTILAPSVEAKLSGDKSEYTLGVNAESGIFHRSSIDNYTDYGVNAGAAWMLNSRNKIELDAAFQREHEDRGTGFSQGSLGALPIDPDEYEETSIGGSYTYGSEQSQGRLVFNLGRSEKEYTNVEALLGPDHGRNRDTDKAGVNFFWNVGGRTDAVLEVTRDDIDFVNEAVGSNSLDNTMTRALVGVQWEVTGKTEGSIKVGRGEKKFKDGARKDFEGNTWDVDVSWSPLKYSTLSLTSGQEAKDPSGQGSYIDAQSIGFSWNHGWNDLISSNLYFNKSDEDYVDSTDARKDKITDYGIQFDYNVRRWMTVGISFGYQERDSNIQSFKYDQNITALHVNLSL